MYITGPINTYKIRPEDIPEKYKEKSSSFIVHCIRIFHVLTYQYAKHPRLSAEKHITH